MYGIEMSKLRCRYGREDLMVVMPSWMKKRLERHSEEVEFLRLAFNPYEIENENRRKAHLFQRSTLEQGYFWGYMDALRDRLGTPKPPGGPKVDISIDYDIVVDDDNYAVGQLDINELPEDVRSLILDMILKQESEWLNENWP